MDTPAPSDLDLLRRFEPVIRYCEGELFLPASIEEYLRSCSLWARGPNGPEELVAAGALDAARLADEGRRQPEPGLWLRLVAQPFGRLQVARWRHRPDRPRFHGGRRLAQVGVTSRIIDVVNRMTLMIRGSVAAGAQAAAETAYREHTTAGHHPYYARVDRMAGYIVVQYWFFYFFNDWRSRVYGVNDHEADWEQVTVFATTNDRGEVEPAWVAYSAHDEVGDDLRRRWDDPDLTLVGEHPVVHAGLGSHSGAYLPGDYLITFDPPALRRAIRLGRRMWRRLLPWIGEGEHAVGIPYVDYHRADGVAVGPAQPRVWAPVLVDDETPWIRDYRGLWGDDTEDPFGGERGPAGPRYERDGRVRLSWGDPVGWAGLDKVSPTEELRREAVRARIEAIEAELGALSAGADAERLTLRARTGSGGQVDRDAELAVAAATMQQVALQDERQAISKSLNGAPEPVGPHHHLRHRHEPLEPDGRRRARVLAVWSALSTSLVLVIIAVLVLPFGPSLLATAALGLLVLFVLEAIARGHLLAFVGSLLLTVVVVSTLVSIAVGLVQNWRITAAVVLCAGALLILMVNLVELARD